MSLDLSPTTGKVTVTYHRPAEQIILTTKPLVDNKKSLPQPPKGPEFQYEDI